MPLPTGKPQHAHSIKAQGNSLQALMTGCPCWLRETQDPQSSPVHLLEVAVGVGRVPGVVEVHDHPGCGCPVDGLEILLEPLVLLAAVLIIGPPAHFDLPHTSCDQASVFMT